ncbi:MAG: sulfurtransferase complex subunit TusB [Pseudomonadota bacterium]|nr:sulfurtransferase complex subunit TusB [Pseudomonadota bacterium]
MLHIVNKSATERNSLESCLRMASKGSAVLLIEDAVYAVTQGSVAAAQIQAAMADLQIYALGPDLDARGMSARVLDGVKVVDYGGFVDLVAETNTCQSWL